MKLTKMIAAAAALALSSGAALASSQPGCSTSSITVSGGGSVTCLGYFSGNVTGNDGHAATTVTDLTPWSVSASVVGSPLDVVGNLSGSTTVTFDQAMYGETIIGIHYGVIKDSSGHKLANDVTAFYKFDAGTAGITGIGNLIASISNATLFKTGTRPVVSSVPEPEIYAMMLAGIGMLGFIARRRKQR